MDHFLENLERFQLEKGKSPDRFIPIEFDYKADTNKVIDRALNVVYVLFSVSLLYFMVKQFKGMGSMGKGGGSDIFNLGTHYLSTVKLIVSRQVSGQDVWS